MSDLLSPQHVPSLDLPGDAEVQELLDSCLGAAACDETSELIR